MGRFVIALALPASPLPCAAQSSPGKVTGRVTDETGGILPGVTVELRHNGLEPLVAVTGSDGTCVFENVTPGIYELTLTLIRLSRSGSVDTASNGSRGAASEDAAYVP